MKAEFVVRGEEGNISWSDKEDGPEAFATLAAAQKRAKALATLSPGQTIGVYRMVCQVVAPVMAVEVRKRP